MSVGIIVTELVSNACKYAYSDGAAGEVRVTLRPADNGHFRLNVQDDGPGLSAGEAPKGTGLGAGSSRRWPPRRQERGRLRRRRLSRQLPAPVAAC